MSWWSVPLCAVVVLAAPSSKPEVDRPQVQAPRLTAPWLGLSRRSGDELDLQATPGGGFRYEDLEGGFVANIRPDGSVEFERLSRAKLKGTPKDAAGWGDDFVDAMQRPTGQRGRTMAEEVDRDDLSRRAAAGMETVPWGPYGPPPILFGIGGSFGVGKRGPSKKAQRDFLKKTEAMRDTMAVRFRERQLDRATRRVSADVVAIWKDSSVPMSIRKRRVFELWDDAEAPVRGDGPLQAKLEQSTAIVRRRIVEAVRKLAPKGSDDAFTPAELDELNAGRKSAERFAPYGTATHSSGKRRRQP